MTLTILPPELLQNPQGSSQKSSNKFDTKEFHSNSLSDGQSIAERLKSGELQQVELFFHPIQIVDRLGSDPLRTIREWFDKKVWPWPAKPLVYVDQRLSSAANEYGYQHAKVVVADATTDRASALVTSANFSENAQRNNFEAGWLVREPWRADQVSNHFRQMVAEGLFVEVP